MEESKTGKQTVEVRGIDKSGCPFTIFKKVKINKE
jgi:hypothetical protein